MAAWNGGVGAVGSSPPLAPSHHGHGHGRMPTAAALRPSNGDGGDNYMMHSQLLGLPPMPCPGQVPTQRRSVSSTSSTSSASAGSDSISSSGGGAATMAAAAAITTQWGAQADGQQQQQLQVTTATAPSPSPSLDQMLARLGASTPTSALTATAAAVMMAPIAANVSTAGATASSGGVYCARCGSARPDVRFPCCGFRIHGRCLVGGGGDQAPWPCRACPGCGEAGGGEGGSGGCVPVEVPLPEPFRRNGEDVRVPPNELAKVRGGRWQEAEVRFAEMVLELFGQGALPMKDGARLGTVLCSLLQCSAARLSSKLRTGKRNFQYNHRGGGATSTAREQAQRALSQQEELFLHFLPAEEAAVAAHALQRGWRVQLLGFLQARGQPVTNLAAWGDMLVEELGEEAAGAMLAQRGETPVTVTVPRPPQQQQAQQQPMVVDAAAVAAAASMPAMMMGGGGGQGGMLLHDGEGGGGGAPGLGVRQRAAAMEEDRPVKARPGKRRSLAPPPPPRPGGTHGPMRGLAQLLVRMNADRRRDYTVAHGVLGATSIDDLLSLLRAGPPQEMALLARASTGAILFASAGLRRAVGRANEDLLGSALFLPADSSPGSGGGLVHPEDAVVLQLAFSESQRRVVRLLEGMGAPQPPVMGGDLAVAPLVLRLRRGGGGVMGSGGNVDAMFGARYHLAAFATEDFLLLHAPGPRVHHHYPAGADGFAGAAAVEVGIRSLDLGVSRAPVDGGTAGAQQRQWRQQQWPVGGQQQQQQQQPQQQLRGGGAITTALQTLTMPRQHGSATRLPSLSPSLPAGAGYFIDSPHHHCSHPTPPSGQMPMSIATGEETEPLPPLPHHRPHATTSRPRVEEVGPDGLPIHTTTTAADANAGGVGGGGWEGEPPLEWCDDEDLSLALQHLGGGDSGRGQQDTVASASDSVASSPSSLQDAWGGAYDLCYAPPTSFEQTMRGFLQGLPFEAVDIWVPLRDPTSGRLSLQFGGGLAVRSTLSQWVFYSRNFAFYEGQGMPGRVFRSQVPEYREDVASLDSTLFLRKAGAREAGVHASFGVPVVQGSTVFVLVFYSGRRGQHDDEGPEQQQQAHQRRPQAIAPETLDYIRRATAGWRIETTFSPTSTSLSTFVSPAQPAGACGGRRQGRP